MIFAKILQKQFQLPNLNKKKILYGIFFECIAFLKGLQKLYENIIASGYFSSLTGNMIHLAK